MQQEFAKSKPLRTLDEFRLAFDNAMHGNRIAFITAKVEASGPEQYAPSVSLLENRFQFRRHIQERVAKPANWSRSMAHSFAGSNRR